MNRIINFIWLYNRVNFKRKHYNLTFTSIKRQIIICIYQFSKYVIITYIINLKEYFKDLYLSRLCISPLDFQTRM